MSDPIALISSVPVTKAELSDLILREHGFVEPGTPLFGRFSESRRHIWIGLAAPEELEAAIEDGGPEYLARMATLLDGPPRTEVVVEISRTEGSERLALEFAILFSATWPAIVDNLQGRLLTRDDLLRCRAAGEDIRYFAGAAPQAAHGGRHPEPV